MQKCLPTSNMRDAHCQTGIFAIVDSSVRRGRAGGQDDLLHACLYAFQHRLDCRIYTEKALFVLLRVVYSLLYITCAQQHCFGMSAIQILPYASVPDVVEVDEYVNGARREGAYYGITQFMYKVSEEDDYLDNIMSKIDGDDEL